MAALRARRAGLIDRVRDLEVSISLERKDLNATLAPEVRITTIRLPGSYLGERDLSS